MATLGEAQAADAFYSRLQASDGGAGVSGAVAATAAVTAATTAAPNLRQAAVSAAVLHSAHGADPLASVIAERYTGNESSRVADGDVDDDDDSAQPVDMARLENEAVLFVRTTQAPTTSVRSRRSRHVRAHSANRVEAMRDRVQPLVTVEQLQQRMTRLRAFMQDAVDTLIEANLPLVETDRTLYVSGRDDDTDEGERRREASRSLVAIWRSCTDPDTGYGLYLDHVFQALEAERTDPTNGVDERTCFAVLLSIFYAYLRRDATTSVRFVHARADANDTRFVELPAVVFAQTPFAVARHRSLQNLLSMLPAAPSSTTETAASATIVNIRVSDVCDAHDPLSTDNELYRLLRFASFVQARLPVLYMLDMPELYPFAWRALMDAVTTANEKLIALFAAGSDDDEVTSSAATSSAAASTNVPRRATVLQQRDEFFELPPCPWLAEHYTYAQIFDWMFGIIDQVGAMCARHCGAAYLEYECRQASSLERTLRGVSSRLGFSRLEHVARSVRRTQSFVSPKEMATFLDDVFAVNYRRVVGVSQYEYVPVQRALLDAVWAAATFKQYTELRKFLAYITRSVPRSFVNVWHVVAHLSAQPADRDVHGVLREQYVQAMSEAFHRRVFDKWLSVVHDEMTHDAATRSYAFPIMTLRGRDTRGRAIEEYDSGDTQQQQQQQHPPRAFRYEPDAFRRSLAWLREQCMMTRAQRLVLEHRWGELYDELHPALRHASFRVCVSSLGVAERRRTAAEPPERIATPVLVRFPGRLMNGDIGTLVHGDNVVQASESKAARLGDDGGGAAGAAKRTKRSGRSVTIRYGLLYCAPDDDADRKQSNTTIVFVDSRECMRAAQSPTGAIDLATVRTHSLTKPTGSKKLEVMLFDNAQGKYFWVPWHTIQDRFRWYNRIDADLPDTYKLASPPSTAWARRQRIDNLRVRAGVRMVPHTVHDQGTNESYTFDVPISVELNEALNRRFLQRCALELDNEQLVRLAVARCRVEHVVRSDDADGSDAAAAIRCALRYLGSLFGEHGAPTLEDAQLDAVAEQWHTGRVTKWSMEAHDRLDAHVDPLHHQTLHVPMRPVAMDEGEATRSVAEDYDRVLRREAAYYDSNGDDSDDTPPPPPAAVAAAQERASNKNRQPQHNKKPSASKYGAFARFTKIEYASRGASKRSNSSSGSHSDDDDDDDNDDRFNAVRKSGAKRVRSSAH